MSDDPAHRPPKRPPNERDRERTEEQGDLWCRRDVLSNVGWAGVLGSIGLSMGGFARLLFRRAPVEPTTVFRAGHAGDYRPGSVSDRFLRKWRVFIVRDDEERLYAVYGKCTHLGCTPRWDKRADRFKCPCHGSGFTSEGVNFEGPAPRPLERARVWTGRDGELRVDVGRRYAEDDWDQQDAWVDVDAVAEPGKVDA